MTRRCLIVLVIGALSVAPLRAELKYTLKTQAHASSVKPTTPPNPLFTMVSSLVLNMIAPPGGSEVTVTVGNRGSRVDYKQAFAMLPAGAVVLVPANGTMVVLDPAAKTYWKAPKISEMQGASVNAPTVNVKRTGTFASIAGVRSEHADIVIKLPLPSGAALPGLPPELQMSGEAWFSDAHKQYARPSGALSGLAGSLGFDSVQNAGFLMRSILRSELFGDQELESVVTEIAEVTAPASAFEIPSGFTEVPAPTSFGAGLPSMGGAR